MPFLIIGVFIILIGFFFLRGMFGNTVPVASSASGTVSVAGPKAQQTLNKTFYFPLKDDSGQELTKLKYEVLSAELRDEIIVKGQKATAVNGRTFLIINIKITNDYEKPVELRARDYVRLTVDGSNEKLAPEIHNDPVEVQALSTKYTRLGFTINSNANNLTLFVGEIGGKKQEIKLNFR